MARASMRRSAEMSDIRIRRSPSRQSYTVVDNRILNDQALSIEAKGLLCYLLSRPDDWTVSLVHLGKLHKIGRDRLNRIMSEIRDAGYARIVTLRDDASGHLRGTAWVVDEAGAESGEADDPAPRGGCDRGPEKASLGEPTEALKNRLSEKPTVGKSTPILNTEDSLNPESDQISPPDIPVLPREGGRASPDFEAKSARRSAAEEDERAWAAFNRVWDWKEREMPGEARAVFLRLSAEDRAAAVRYAPRFVEANAGKMRAFAHNWLRQRNWTHYVEQDAAEARKKQDVIGKRDEVEMLQRAKYGGVVIYVGKPEHAAWARHDAALGVDWRREQRSYACGQGYIRPSRWPPSKVEIPSSATSGDELREAPS
jgi:hypothetical protein